MTTGKALHRIWHLGNDVDTDALAPGAYMQHGIEVISAHCLESLLPSFATDVRKGDVIVAGSGFGIGSSREQAAAALVHLGVAAVIAPSYGGLFFRNAFNLGLLLLTCPDAAELGGEGQLSITEPALSLQTASGKNLACEPVPDFLLQMVRMGGLMASLKQRKALAALPVV
ncbi:MAG: 3-isopropylmalate dehydratase [Polaromonas sp.]|uniref:LeuD/DmdB family oxidoreductase small subunit n=1 Tax=Polaromonas sp. TaxID=1869339 RepID=UPI0025DC7F7F|nr:3-isopropylmalate dehydratase [Polaromonas sp.]MBI2725506.1 3-isopropylmalate dehydratase [Polaromonas sp.]